MEEKDVKSTSGAGREESRHGKTVMGEDQTNENVENAVDTDPVEKLTAELADMKDKYLRQAAEFDNFRKRTAKERVELIQTAGKDIITSLLDVVDDMDRAQQQMTEMDEVSKEGILLIFNKLRSILQSKGLKEMKSVGEDFNPDLHEAITEIPAPSADLQGKVLDEIQKGYYLGDKIIRFAKVVVGK